MQLEHTRRAEPAAAAVSLEGVGRASGAPEAATRLEGSTFAAADTSTLFIPKEAAKERTLAVPAVVAGCSSSLSSSEAVGSSSSRVPRSADAIWNQRAASGSRVSAVAARAPTRENDGSSSPRKPPPELLPVHAHSVRFGSGVGSDDKVRYKRILDKWRAERRTSQRTLLSRAIAFIHFFCDPQM